MLYHLEMQDTHTPRPENLKYLTKSHCFSAATMALFRKETQSSDFVLIVGNRISSG